MIRHRIPSPHAQLSTPRSAFPYPDLGSPADRFQVVNAAIYGIEQGKNPAIEVVIIPVQPAGTAHSSPRRQSREQGDTVNPLLELKRRRVSNLFKAATVLLWLERDRIGPIALRLFTDPTRHSSSLPTWKHSP